MSTEPNLLSPAETAVSADTVVLRRSDLHRIGEICARAARGDLEARLIGFADHPELAELARAINLLLDISDSFVRESSAAMAEASRDRFHRPILLRGLHGAYRQSAATINRAGCSMRESSEQLAMVQRMATDNATNVSTVAAACEELASTGREIMRQTTVSAGMTNDAVGQVTRASESVRALTDVAGKIDRVVALINQVAGQTNLLALNATIEAARAGEAGKGFAVVANEVKELSRGTRNATREIEGQVKEMQATVRSVDEVFASIRKQMEQLSGSVQAIQGSMRDQEQANGEISRSISQLSSNSAQVSERIGRSRHATA